MANGVTSVRPQNRATSVSEWPLQTGTEWEFSGNTKTKSGKLVKLAKLIK